MQPDNVTRFGSSGSPPANVNVLGDGSAKVACNPATVAGFAATDDGHIPIHASRTGPNIGCRCAHSRTSAAELKLKLTRARPRTVASLAYTTRSLTGPATPLPPRASPAPWSV